MKRRSLLKSFAAVPAAAALHAQQPPVPPKPTARVIEETPKIEASIPDGLAQGVPTFFNASQFSALQRLSDILMPAANGMPGALAAGAPAFLDFLIGASPADRKTLYSNGLDKLNAEAGSHHGKAFAQVSNSDADALLAPLHEPWAYGPIADPFANFLARVKEDVIAATTNSREWIAVASKRSRGAGGLAAYWYPID